MSKQNSFETIFPGLVPLVTAIRKYKIASWCFAMCIGYLFYIFYGITKHLFWARDLDHLYAWLNPKTKLQIFIFVVSLNILVAITSSLPAAVLCGLILVRLFGGKASLYGWGAILIVLLLQSRLLHIKYAPDLSIKISALITPLLVSITFYLGIFIVKRKRRMREGL